MGGVPLVRSSVRRMLGAGPAQRGPAVRAHADDGIFAGAQAGQYVAALTGVEIALWDLAGKALGLPVYQLLGGKMRDKIRIYCDSQTEDPDDPQAPAKIARHPRHGLHRGQDRHRRARPIRSAGTR